MENENVFEADAVIESGQGVSGAARSTGVKAASSAAGGFPAPASGQEGTPLLSREDSDGASDHGDDDERRPLVGKDTEVSPFAHLPWWRRPSVSSNHPFVYFRHSIVLTISSADLLVAFPILADRTLLWWRLGTQDQHHPVAAMRAVLCGAGHAGPGPRPKGATHHHRR